MEVIPAPLENDPDSLTGQIELLSPFYQTFQVDIADGIYVPNKTVQISELISLFQQFNNKTIKQLTFDFHLMVKDYESYIDQLKILKSKIRIGNIFIHFSLKPDIKLMESIYPDFKFGIVLNPDDEINDLVNENFFPRLRIIQIMSVNPGFQGQSFLPDTLKKIEQLSAVDYRYKIYLDGAINENTLPQILQQKNKPDALCIGSYLTRAGNDLERRIGFLKAKAG